MRGQKPQEEEVSLKPLQTCVPLITKMVLILDLPWSLIVEEKWKVWVPRITSTISQSTKESLSITVFREVIWVNTLLRMRKVVKPLIIASSEGKVLELLRHHCFITTQARNQLLTRERLLLNQGQAEEVEKSWRREGSSWRYSKTWLDLRKT